MGDGWSEGQSKFTPERQEAILVALREGRTVKQACEVAGLYHGTLDTWRARHAWFDEAVRDAIAGSPRRITRATLDAALALMLAGSTGATAAASVGVSYEGLLRWADRNGFAGEMSAASDKSRALRAKPKTEKRRLTSVEKIDRDMTDDVIAAVAARVREVRGVQTNSLNTVEESVVAVLGRRPAAFHAWRKAFAERAEPIAEAVRWVRSLVPEARALELMEPGVRRAMLDAVEKGRGWNGVAKAAGVNAERLKRWCEPPFVNDEHARFVGEMMAAWEREKEERAAAARGHVTSKRARRDKDQRLRGTYGMTLLQAEAMQARQRGGCAICGTKLRPIGEVHDPRSDGDTKPVVDHCHDTGKVRGILCGPCNTGIGQLGDSADTLESATRYLRQTQPRQAQRGQGGVTTTQEAPKKAHDSQCELWALQKAHGCPPSA